MLLASPKSNNFEVYKFCDALQKSNLKGFKALEWAAGVEMKKNTKCVDIASVELAKKLTTEKHYGFFLGVQSGGLNDVEIDMLAKKLIAENNN
jgi:hypothetical protein